MREEENFPIPPSMPMGASHFCKLIVGASRSLLDPLGSETFVLRTGFANPLRFFCFFEMLLIPITYSRLPIPDYLFPITYSRLPIPDYRLPNHD